MIDDDAWGTGFPVEPLTALAGGILAGVVVSVVAWRRAWRAADRAAHTRRTTGVRP